MTAPIVFPNLTPAPRSAPQRNSGVDEFVQLMLHIRQQREQLALRRDELEQEKLRTESSLANDAQSRKESQLRIKQTEEKQEDEELAASVYNDLALKTGGKLSEADFSAGLADIAARKPKRLNAVFSEFQKRVREGAEVQTTFAQQQRERTEAEVGSKTKEARIASGNLQDDIAAQQLRGAKLEASLAQMRVDGFDASRLDAARALWMSSQKPWGAVRKQFGLPAVKGGMDDKDVYTKAGADGDAQREAFADNLRGIVEGLNAMSNKGLTPVAFGLLNSNPTGLISGTAVAMGQGFISEEQQRLMNHYGALAAFSQTVLVRGAASDRDVALVRQALTTLDRDGKATQVQKALLRNAFVVSFSRVGSGQYNATLETMLKIAKQSGVKDPSLLAPFYQLRGKFKKADETSVDPDDAIIDNVAGSRR